MLDVCCGFLWLPRGVLVPSCFAWTPPCGGFSCCKGWASGWGLPVDAALRLSRPAARGIFRDQGLNPRPLHWRADSYPLDHQGGPSCEFFINAFYHVADVPFYSQFIECLVAVFLIMKGCLILSNASFCIN